MDKRFLIGGQFKAHGKPTDGSIMSIEGYASTDDKDRQGDVILPTAWSAGLTDFLKFPVLLVNHKWDAPAIGKIRELIIDEKGLRVVADIADTAAGREIKTLIEFGVLKSFSVGFTVPDGGVTMSEDGTTITEAILLEVSVVNVPANMEALFSEAKSHNIELKYFNSTGGGGETIGKGVIILTDIKKEVAEAIDPIEKEIGKVRASMDDVKDEVTKLAQLHTDISNTSRKTEGELKTLVEKATGDFKEAITQLEKGKADSRNRQIAGLFAGTSTIAGHNYKSLMAMSNERVKATFTADEAKRVERYRELNDQVLMVDRLLDVSSRKFGGSYHEHNKADRVKGLNSYKEFNEFRKAMDSTTANEGDEFVPTLQSPTLEALVRINLRVAMLHETIQMPSNPFTLPVEGADTIAKKIGETTAVVSGFDSDEETPGTSNVTFTAVKARGRVQISNELTEDSAVAILPYVNNKLAISIARAVEAATINGDTAGTHQDSNVTAATDFQKAWDGYRKIGQGANDLDMGTFSTANLRALRVLMGKYGQSPNDMAIVCSLNTYLGKFLTLAEVSTVDKLGPAAVILTGQLAAFDGTPIITSEFAYTNLNAVGVYDGVTTTKSVVCMVNKQALVYGVARQMQVGTEYDLINDVFQVVAFKRIDFQSLFAVASNPVVVEGFNIAT